MLQYGKLHCTEDNPSGSFIPTVTVEENDIDEMESLTERTLASFGHMAVGNLHPGQYIGDYRGMQRGYMKAIQGFTKVRECDFELKHLPGYLKRMDTLIKNEERWSNGKNVSAKTVEAMKEHKKWMDTVYRNALEKRKKEIEKEEKKLLGEATLSSKMAQSRIIKSTAPKDGDFSKMHTDFLKMIKGFTKVAEVDTYLNALPDLNKAIDINTKKAKEAKNDTLIKGLRDHKVWMNSVAKRALTDKKKELEEKQAKKHVIKESVETRDIVYRLGDSYLFNMANKNIKVKGERLVDVIPKMTKDGYGFTHITYDMLDKTLVYELFESNRFRLPNKTLIRTFLQRQSIQMVYSETYRIPTSIPYIFMTGKTPKLFVNVSDFVEMDEYGKVNVTQTRNYNALFAVLLAAVINYILLYKRYATLPVKFEQPLVLMYANMVEKCINYLVHMDEVTKEKVRYLAAKFALVQMYGTQTGLSRFLSYKQFFPKLSKMIQGTLDDTFPEDSFDDISLFITQLSTQYPIMRGLTVYNVYERWIRSYGPATAMSLDYMGYHIYTVCMVLMESPLINRLGIEPILEKNKGSDIYQAIQAMLKAF